VIVPSLLQATRLQSRKATSMTGKDQNGATRIAFQDAFANPNRAQMARPEPRLKIIFVDSCSHRRSSRLRHNTPRAIRQNHDLSFAEENETFCDEPQASTGRIRGQVSEDESDQNYSDDNASSTKRSRGGRFVRHARKLKRHGKLAAADRDLILEAQRGGLTHKPPKDKASRIAKADAINLVSAIAKKIDWRQAVEVQNELKTFCDEPLAKSDKPESRKWSASTKMDGDALPGDLQLKEYWSDVLVSSVLEMKTR
jgi:hypothetical protein